MWNERNVEWFRKSFWKYTDVEGKKERQRQKVRRWSEDGKRWRERDLWQWWGEEGESPPSSQPQKTGQFGVTRL